MLLTRLGRVLSEHPPSSPCNDVVALLEALSSLQVRISTSLSPARILPAHVCLLQAGGSQGSGQQTAQDAARYGTDPEMRT